MKVPVVHRSRFLFQFVLGKADRFVASEVAVVKESVRCPVPVDSEVLLFAVVEFLVVVVGGFDATSAYDLGVVVLFL